MRKWMNKKITIVGGSKPNELKQVNSFMCGFPLNG